MGIRGGTHIFTIMDQKEIFQQDYVDDTCVSYRLLVGGDVGYLMDDLQVGGFNL